MARVAPPFLILSLALIGAGCDAPPAASKATPWLAADHDNVADSRSNKQGPQVPQPAKPQGEASANSGSENAQNTQTAANAQSTLAELVWSKQCSSCHGPTGHGDGMNGAATGAVNLANPDLQARLSDADIRRVLREGKGKMPKFTDLPEEIAQALVQKVRSFR
jgi:mono/diheme cytochrome c family protein